MANYTFDDLNAKNLKFLSGSQADLNKYLLDSEDIKSGQAIEGAFYLTYDTHRLYIGGQITYENSNSETVTAVIPIPVNAGILSVSTLEDLPSIQEANPGEFYYVSNNNILCMFNGSQWVQINPDTDTNDIVEVSSISVSAGSSVTGTYIRANAFVSGETYYEYSDNAFTEISSPLSSNSDFVTNSYYIRSTTNGNTLVYTLITNQTKIGNGGNGSATALEAVTSQLVIPVSDLTNIGKVGLKTTIVTNNTTELQIDSVYADSTKTVSFIGAGGVSLSGGGTSAITVKGKQYDLRRGTSTTDETSISLYDITEGAAAGTLVSNATITINAGDNLILDTTSETATIALNHDVAGTAVTAVQVTPDKVVVDEKTYYTTIDAVTAVTGLTTGNPISQTYYEIVQTYGDNNVTISEGATIKIPRIEKDKNGHIVNISDVGVVLPSARAIGAISANSSGNIIINDTAGTNIVTSNNDLYYTINIDGTTTTVYNQNLLGNFYSTTKIDAIIENNLKNLNALTYKGTVGLQTSTVEVLPIVNSGVAVGDVYLVDSGVNSLLVNSATATVHPGDLLIAKGDEFIQTSDTEVNIFKTYYTRSTTATPHSYVRVTAPQNANITSYYENSGIIQSDLNWTLIEAGDIDTRYDLDKGNGTTINFNENSNIKKSITINGDNTWINTSLTSTGTQLIYEINHADSGLVFSDPSTITATYGDQSATRTLASDGTGTFIVPEIVVDKKGHITNIVNKTITLPASVNDTYLLDNKQSDGNYNSTIYLHKNTSDLSGTLTLIGDSSTSISASGIMVYGSVTGIYIKHATLTPTATSVTTTIADNNNTFNVITGIGYDSFGHINSITSTTYTLPNRYSLRGSSSINTSTVNNITRKSFINSLYQGESQLSTITYNSETLDFTVNSSTTSATSYSVDIKWGSF